VQQSQGRARRGPRGRWRGRRFAEAAECRAGEGGECEHGRFAPPDLRRGDGRHGHRRDLDVGAPLIGVDLEEHVADAQGRALVVGHDDLDLRHAGHLGGTNTAVATDYRVPGSDRFLPEKNLGGRVCSAGARSLRSHGDP
jgi:hypothetical protein